MKEHNVIVQSTLPVQLLVTHLLSGRLHNVLQVCCLHQVYEKLTSI